MFNVSIHDAVDGRPVLLATRSLDSPTTLDPMAHPEIFDRQESLLLWVCTLLFVSFAGIAVSFACEGIVLCDSVRLSFLVDGNGNGVLIRIDTGFLRFMSSGDSGGVSRFCDPTVRTLWCTSEIISRRKNEGDATQKLLSRATDYMCTLHTSKRMEKWSHSYSHIIKIY